MTNNLKQLLRAYLGVILSLGLFCINSIPLGMYMVKKKTFAKHPIKILYLSYGENTLET